MNKLFTTAISLIIATALYANTSSNETSLEYGINSIGFGIIPVKSFIVTPISSGVQLEMSKNELVHDSLLNHLRHDLVKYYDGITLEVKDGSNLVQFRLTSENPKLVAHLQKSQGRILQVAMNHRLIVNQNDRSDYWTRHH